MIHLQVPGGRQPPVTQLLEDRKSGLSPDFLHLRFRGARFARARRERCHQRLPLCCARDVVQQAERDHERVALGRAEVSAGSGRSACLRSLCRSPDTRARPPMLPADAFDGRLRGRMTTSEHQNRRPGVCEGTEPRLDGTDAEGRRSAAMPSGVYCAREDRRKPFLIYRAPSRRRVLPHLADPPSKNVPVYDPDVLAPPARGAIEPVPSSAPGSTSRRRRT